MQGTMLVYPIDLHQTEIVTLNKPPNLDVLQSKVGGYIEEVPQFHWIDDKNKKCRCVAFCDEEGKLKNKPVNLFATALWKRSLRYDGINPDRLDDVLVGSIVVLYGDSEFMAEL